MQTFFKVNYLQFLLIFSIIALASCQKDLKSTEANNALSADKIVAGKTANATSATSRVFSTGLNHPRGLKFGPDGYLYVAEAGTGPTPFCSTQSFGPYQPHIFSPYFGCPTGGRISRIDPLSGTRATVVNNLPTSSGTNGDVFGPADVAFMDNTMYVLQSGAGNGHGVPSSTNGIYRINSNGSHTMVADLGAWSIANPSAHFEEGDYTPEGNWYNMVVAEKKFYALDPNQGNFVKASLDGNIELVTDISASEGHNVPTALAYKGNFFVGDLGEFPIEGNSSIFKITPSGNIKKIATGFSAIIGLVLDKHSNIYVLEITPAGTGNPGPTFPTPGKGRIRKIDPNGTVEDVISGLSLPTAMTMGPDGNLYVSNWGFGPPKGEIIKVTLNN